MKKTAMVAIVCFFFSGEYLIQFYRQNEMFHYTMWRSPLIPTRIQFPGTGAFAGFHGNCVLFAHPGQVPKWMRRAP